jgi:serralysin
VLSSGKYLAVGASSDDDGEIVLAEFNSDGSANSSFGSSGITDYDAYEVSLAVALNVNVGGDGEIQIGGLTDADGEMVILTEFTSAGALDTSYGDDGSYLLGLAGGSNPWTIATNGSGGVLVIGWKSGKLYIADVEV